MDTGLALLQNTIDAHLRAIRPLQAVVGLHENHFRADDRDDSCGYPPPPFLLPLRKLFRYEYRRPCAGGFAQK